MVHLMLVVDGFNFTGESLLDDTRLRQSVQSNATGVTYCFYTNVLRDVQQQFDTWFSDFVVGRESFHLHSREETRRALAVFQRAPMQTKTSSGKDKKS